MTPEFDDLDAAADYVKFQCKTAPVTCIVQGALHNVWGDGYAEYIGEDDTAGRNEPPCAECGAMTQAEAETRCKCAGDKDDCHGCQLWPD